MLNYLWALMILVGILYGVLTGNMAEITKAAIDSSGEAVSLCITMAGIMAFWMGLMEIATQAGIAYIKEHGKCILAQDAICDLVQL